ncbi:MAG: hypothetical protein WCI38_04875 [Chthoniobacterales bacterium]|jgi:hypothetical protein
MNPRSLHRRISPWLLLPLAAMAASGMAYRLGHSWFGLSGSAGEEILGAHTWEWLGPTGSMAVIWFTGLGLLALCWTGMKLVWQSRGRLLKAPQNRRLIHRLVGAVLLLPLAATAITGIAYRTGEAAGWPDDLLDALMIIHEGAWLGKTAKPYYVLALGSGLLCLCFTGIRMVWNKAKR